MHGVLLLTRYVVRGKMFLHMSVILSRRGAGIRSKVRGMCQRLGKGDTDQR